MAPAQPLARPRRVMDASQPRVRTGAKTVILASTYIFRSARCDVGIVISTLMPPKILVTG